MKVTKTIMYPFPCFLVDMPNFNIFRVQGFKLYLGKQRYQNNVMQT